MLAESAWLLESCRGRSLVGRGVGVHSMHVLMVLGRRHRRKNSERISREEGIVLSFDSRVDLS